MAHYIWRFVVLALVALSTQGFASDVFLKLGEIKGERSPRLIRCPDGACTIEGLPAGSFTVTVCDEKGNAVTSDNFKLTMTFTPEDIRESPTRASTGVTGTSEVIAPRDAASGLPTGKRQHKPLKVTKEWDKSTPKLAVKTPEGDQASTQTNATVMRWKLEVRVDKIEMK